jgi:hypothetical protein
MGKYLYTLGEQHAMSRALPKSSPNPHFEDFSETQFSDFEDGSKTWYMLPVGNNHSPQDA